MPEDFNDAWVAAFVTLWLAMICVTFLTCAYLIG